MCALPNNLIINMYVENVRTFVIYHAQRIKVKCHIHVSKFQYWYVWKFLNGRWPTFIRFYHSKNIGNSTDSIQKDFNNIFQTMNVLCWLIHRWCYVWLAMQLVTCMQSMLGYHLDPQKPDTTLPESTKIITNDGYTKHGSSAGLIILTF